MEILSLNPITEISLVKLLFLYSAYFLAGFAFFLPFYLLLRYRLPKRKMLSLPGIIIGTPVEEGIFRAFPLMLLGPGSLIYFHFAWALSHVRPPAIVFSGVSGLLGLRLWLGGLWLEGILIHLFHNLLLFSIVQTIRRVKRKES